MVQWFHGDQEASPLCIQVYVSYCMDTEIQVQGVGERGGRVFVEEDGRDKEVSS